MTIMLTPALLVVMIILCTITLVLSVAALAKIMNLADRLTLTDVPGRVGQIIHGIRQLGVSNEALKLMYTLPRGRDGLGEIDCFKSNDGVMNFGWLGGAKKLVDCAKMDSDSMSRSWTAPTPDQVTIIPNDFPEEAKKIVDER